MDRTYDGPCLWSRSLPPATSARSGKIAATWVLSAEEATIAAVAGSSLVTEVILDDGPAPLFDPCIRALFSPERTTSKLEVFPATRRLIVERVAPEAPPADLTEMRLRLSLDPRKYHGVRREIVRLALTDAVRAAGHLAARGVVSRWEQPDALAGIKRSYAALAPWLRLAGVELRGDVPAVRFVRDDGTELELEDLSESEQQALLFAVVFDRVGLAGSIVLIDQPEMFLHPADHVRFLRVLASLGEDNQIIATTSSQELLAAAAPQAVLSLPARRSHRA